MRVGEALEEIGEAEQESTRQWWLPLGIGLLWVIYAFIVLSASVDSVWAVTLLFAIGAIGGGVLEFALVTTATDWKWAHGLFGIASILAGLVALAWPGQTFVVLASIVGWLLLFNGVLDGVMAISNRHDEELWWLGLIGAGAQIALAVWAVGYSGRSIALLIVWVGVAALLRGLTNVFVGISLAERHREVSRLLGAK